MYKLLLKHKLISTILTISSLGEIQVKIYFKRNNKDVLFILNAQMMYFKCA